MNMFDIVLHEAEEDFCWTVAKDSSLISMDWGWNDRGLNPFDRLDRLQQKISFKEQSKRLWLYREWDNHNFEEANRWTQEYEEFLEDERLSLVRDLNQKHSCPGMQVLFNPCDLVDANTPYRSQPKHTILRWVIFTDEDKVSIVRYGMVVGTNQQTGKRFIREDRMRFTFKWDPKTKRFRSWVIRGKKVREQSSFSVGSFSFTNFLAGFTTHSGNAYSSTGNDLRDQYIATMIKAVDEKAQQFGFTNHRTALAPWIETLKEPTKSRVAIELVSGEFPLMFFGATALDVSRKVVGRNYPKDVSKAVAQMMLEDRWQTLLMASVAKFVHVPNLRQMGDTPEDLNMDRFLQIGGPQMTTNFRKRLAKVLREIAPQRRFRVLFSREYHFVDLLHMWNQVQAANIPFDFSQVRSWEDVHDVLSQAMGKVDHNKLPIPQELYADVPTQIGDHIAVVIPQITSEVIQWGQEQRHCIGGYASSAATGTCLLLGFRDTRSDKWIGHMMIQGNYVSQFYAAMNQPVAADLADPIIEALGKAKVIKVTKVPQDAPAWPARVYVADQDDRF